MKEKLLYAAWACLYGFCVALSFVSNPEGFGKFLLTVTSVIFFLPGALLLYEGWKTGNTRLQKQVRIISVLSLSLTLIMIICNFLSVNASAETGYVLYVLLAMASAPMLSAQNWLLSMFLWACLLFASFKKPRNS